MCRQRMSPGNKRAPVFAVLKLTWRTGFEWNEQVNETVSQAE